MYTERHRQRYREIYRHRDRERDREREGENLLYLHCGDIHTALDQRCGDMPTLWGHLDVPTTTVGSNDGK